jgi:hypothetical protein
MQRAIGDPIATALLKGEIFDGVKVQIYATSDAAEELSFKIIE